MAENTADDTASRVWGRPFAPGQSGNPGGRPKGARNKTTLACQDLLDGEGEALTRILVERAKKGDPVALRPSIERVIPRGSSRAVQLDLPQLHGVADIVEACGAVIDSAASGEITLAEAQAYMALLDVQRKAIETQDLAVRIEVLELRAKERKR